LVEFKAGRMNRDEETNRVSPDKRPGTVVLKKVTPDGLIQFLWKDKLTGTVVEEYILMSDDAVFRKVEESNARVYLLEWKTSNRKFFYWMQDKTDEKDQENCQTINKYINNPNLGNTQEGGGSGGGNFTSGGQVNSQQLYNILNRARQQHQGGRGSSTSTTNTQGSTSPTPNTTSNTSTTQVSGTDQTTTGETGETGGTGVQLSHLRSLLQRHTKPSGPSLVDVMDPNELGLLGIFQNEEVLNALKEYLPEGNDSTSETFEANVRSAPFQQALKIFSYALRHSSDMAGLLFSLGLDPNLAGPNTTIEEFLRALQDAVNQKRMDTENK